MKAKILAFLSPIIVICGLIANEKSLNELETLEEQIRTKGKVTNDRLYQTKKYTLEKNGNKYVVLDSFGASLLQSTTISENKRLLKELLYEKGFLKCSYTYNEKKQYTSAVCYYPNTKRNKSQSAHYVDGVMREKTYYYEDGITPKKIIQYTEDGIIDSVIEYNPKRKPVYKADYHNGVCVSETITQ